MLKGSEHHQLRNFTTSVYRDILAAIENTGEVLAISAQSMGELLQATRSIIIGRGDRPAFGPVEWTRDEPNPALDEISVRLANSIQDLCLSDSPKNMFVADVLHDQRVSFLIATFEALGVRAFIAQPLICEDECYGTLISYSALVENTWTESLNEDLVEIRDFLSLALKQSLETRARSSSESLYRRVAEHSKSNLVHFDPLGKVILVNPRFQELTGLLLSDVRGKIYTTLLELIVVPADLSNVLKSYREVFSGGSTQGSIEYRIRHTQSNEIHWVLDQLQLLHGEEGEIVGYESFAFNITGKYEAEEKLRRSEARYRRLVEHSDAVIFHTDRNHAISFISRRTLDFFGVSPEDFVAGDPVYWYELVHPEDRPRIQAVVQVTNDSLAPFDEEFRVINHVTGKVRWLFARLVPVRSNEGDVEGWDGFGIDITVRKESQEALLHQSKKIRALYTVSAAIRGFLDPPNIASRGLSALCDATGADAGVCYVVDSGSNAQLQLVAHHGFTEDFHAAIARTTSLPNLARYVSHHGQSVVISDMRNDPRAGKTLAEEYRMLSAVLVPIAVEDETLGTLGLFSKELSSFDGGDVMLVSAAANQIGLAARQANLFTAYRRQTSQLSALYRISHELSRNLSLDEMFSQAFTIIQDELGLKRLWLGLLNETGTRIVGQAAYGPGWRRKLVEINVEIIGREHPLARVVATRTPVVIDNPNEVLEEFGVRRIFSRLAIHSVALVPLIAGGQVLGVLAVQPSSDEMLLDRDSITLLSSLANEIAAILLTKKLEERIGESEKMRTAGLLAAGITHNFNNLLQAILGQASLLEMQGGSPEKVARAAKLITDAANKGAELVRKLLGFAHLDEPVREKCDVDALIERSIPSLEKVLGEKHKLVSRLPGGLPRALVDPRHLVQILAAIVANSRDALGDAGTVEIFSRHLNVDHQSPHYEVPYGDYILVGVRDNGMGMDEETKRRCFEPFFTTKNVDPASGVGMSGSGLGLAAAYALARKNGGRLAVDSRPNHGALFTLYIPVADHGPSRAQGKAETNLPETLARSSSSGLEVEVIKGHDNSVSVSESGKKRKKQRRLHVVSGEEGVAGEGRLLADDEAGKEAGSEAGDAASGESISRTDE